MLEVITNKELIAKYQGQFIQKLKRICKEPIACILGHRGDSGDATVFYSSYHNFWFASFKNENRYWNGFGIGKPSPGKNVYTTVQINPPLSGINRNTGGVYAKDEKGNIYILHRGQIGGGREGIGKSLFFDKYSGPKVIATEERAGTEFAVVTSLNSSQFAQQISNFVIELSQIKNLSLKDGKAFSFLNKYQFTAEPTGKRKAPQYDKGEIDLKHGIVINALKIELENRKLKVANDRNRDLFTHKKGMIKQLFEVKTSSSTQDLYRAVGQLLIYSIPFKSKVDLIMVLPQKLNQTVEKRLNGLGIKCMYYSWGNNKPIFHNLLNEKISINS